MRSKRTIDGEGVNWRLLNSFIEVANAKSFSRASHVLQISQSAVSRQIQLLETQVEAPLFYRSWKGLVLTEAGHDLIDVVKDMKRALQGGLIRVSEKRRNPEGHFKISTTMAFGSAWLSRRLLPFHEQNPHISVSILMSDDTEPDLSLGEADCAIRFAEQTEYSLVSRNLAQMTYNIYASTSYIEKHGRPSRPEELRNNTIIIYGENFELPHEGSNWLARMAADACSGSVDVVRINSVYGICMAASMGLGIAALPYYLAGQCCDLERIMDEFDPPPFKIYFVYPEESRQSKRINVFRDFLVEQFDIDRRAGLTN